MLTSAQAVNRVRSFRAGATNKMKRGAARATIGLRGLSAVHRGNGRLRNAVWSVFLKPCAVLVIHIASFGRRRLYQPNDDVRIVHLI
jgi:hypothetical protein